MLIVDFVLLTKNRDEVFGGESFESGVLSGGDTILSKRGFLEDRSSVSGSDALDCR